MSVTPPRLSVIIPAHNAASVLGEQLEALRVQEGADPFEVLVCDNNSTDGTAQLALDEAGSLDLRVVDASGPARASHARNRGASAARGAVLLFCDADDLVDAHWVRELSAPLLDGADVIAAGALHHERFNDTDVLAAYGITPDPDPASTPESKAPAGYAGYLPTAPGGNFAIRPDRYLALGGMDPSYPGGAEETDFAWRAQLTGTEVVTRPRAVVHYRLKHAPRALFRQQRIQHCARILLWTRYRSSGMTGPSLKHSIVQIAFQVPNLLRRQSRADRLRTARILGGNVGALQGILAFRILRLNPAPQSITAETLGAPAR
ncbi:MULTISPECIES: glycosyltransferase family 2 protein [Brachybacterium]|uniref:glycosyltransferase family 2 protein n=1 Tax=Brachybacterium TaxID=43668 RepID=UPI0021A632A8|nr:MULTISPECIES: glycosyltransferase family A protein [Brachybacterium]MCT1909553.1 glycosyltransferase family 2 protein [Brachybacterium paraconglomeratum]